MKNKPMFYCPECGKSDKHKQTVVDMGAMGNILSDLVWGIVFNCGHCKTKWFMRREE